MKRYIGHVLELIYLDAKGHITKREVRVDSVKGSYLRVWCYSRRGPRILLESNILAFRTVHRNSAS